MSDDKDGLKSIKVYKFDNTKGSCHEFALKFRAIADSRGYEDIIDGTKSPPDEKENLEIISGDNTEKQKAKKEKLAAKMANKRVIETWSCLQKASHWTLLRMQHLKN